MKKIFTLFLSIVLFCSIGIFVGCDSKATDNTELLNKIAALEKQLEEANNGSDSELSTDVATLKTTVASLQETITLLTEALNNSSSGNAALKEKLDNLITDLDAANARVAILEGIANGTAQLPVYEVGVEGKDTFTFVNNGIKLFSVRIESYGERVGASGIYLTGYITNYAMSTSVNLCTYLDGQILSTDDKIYNSNGEFRKFKVSLNTPTEFTIQFDKVFNVEIPIDEVKNIYLGIPNQIADVTSIIPYAIFKLPVKA